MILDWYLTITSVIIGSIFKEDVYIIIMPTNINIKLPKESTPILHKKKMKFYCAFLRILSANSPF